MTPGRLGRNEMPTLGNAETHVLPTGFAKLLTYRHDHEYRLGVDSKGATFLKVKESYCRKGLARQTPLFSTEYHRVMNVCLWL